MKKLILCVILFSVASVYAGDRKQGGKAAQAFEKMKSLAGEWQAKGEDGTVKRLQYQVVANGTTLQETFSVDGKQEYTMVTMYHLDGDALMLTHYCMANNQPRMRATDIRHDFSEIVFNFVDATNLVSRDEGHMHQAVFTFNNDGTLSNAWTFRKNGENAFTEADIYSRTP